MECREREREREREKKTSIDEVITHGSCKWACSLMVGRSSGTLPPRVEIVALAHFLIYSDFENVPRSAGVQSFKGAHRDRVCVRIFIEVIVRA
jgi:hypothetical protein